MLASPIILPDHPRVADESPGDLFDGGEIDQLLHPQHPQPSPRRRRRRCGATDPGAREILERTEALSDEELLRLHGTIREFRDARGGVRPGHPLGGARAARSGLPDGRRGRGPPRQQGAASAAHPGRRLRPGALAGSSAVVEKVEQDMEGLTQAGGGGRGRPGARPRRPAPARASLLLRPRGSRAARPRGGCGGLDPGPGRRDRQRFPRRRRLRRRARATASRERDAAGGRGRDFGIRGMDLA